MIAAEVWDWWWVRRCTGSALWVWLVRFPRVGLFVLCAVCLFFSSTQPPALPWSDDHFRARPAMYIESLAFMWWLAPGLSR
jgi:hypothetical protein